MKIEIEDPRSDGITFSETYLCQGGHSGLGSPVGQLRRRDRWLRTSLSRHRIFHRLDLENFSRHRDIHHLLDIEIQVTFLHTEVKENRINFGVERQTNH